MNKLSFFIIILFFLWIPFIGYSEEKCENIQCVKTQYEKADLELNRLYKKIITTLNTTDKKELINNEIDWINTKEYICGFQAQLAQMDTKDIIKNVEYYNCLKDFTQTRIEYLQSYLNKNLTNDITGYYTDSMGGILEITRNKNNTINFNLTVVRGPTAHIGELDGIIKINKKSGEYKDTEMCKELNTPCCKLTFQIFDEKIVVKEYDCQAFHGVRAYFDGTYRKIKN